MRTHLLLISLALLCSTACAPKHHHVATVKLQLVEPGYSETSLDSGMESWRGLRSAINPNRFSNILLSETLISEVAQRLRSEGLDQAFVVAYDEPATVANIRSILKEHRKVMGTDGGLVLQLSYAHPDPEMAVKVANLYAETFIDYLIKLNTQSAQKAVEALGRRVEQEAMRIQLIQEKIEAFMVEHEITEGELERRDESLRKELNQLMRKGLSSEDEEVAKIEQELIKLSRIRVERNSLQRDLEVQESFYDALIRRQATELKQTEGGLQPSAVIREAAALSPN